MSDQAFDPRRFGKTARNEQRKLVATSFNTVGLAVLGIGFLTPALTGEPLSRAPQDRARIRYIADGSYYRPAYPRDHGGVK